MKRLFIFCLGILMLVFSTNICWAAPWVTADAAVLIDANTGQVLFGKNLYQKRPPASTTKILTGIMALEMGKPNEVVIASRRAAHTEGSSIYLTEGEKLILDQIVQGALMKSGNDACVAIAEHIAGSVEEFAQLMNIKAKLLGAGNSNFVNPHGLPDERHYTTAYDLAVIARYAMQNKRFAEIVGQKEKQIDWYGQTWKRKLVNTNDLLWRYIWAEGIKTGTTRAAGQCLVSSASKDCRKLIAVVLRSGDRYGDSERLFEYGFDNFTYQQVAVAGEYYGSADVENGIAPKVQLAFKKDLGVLVAEDRTASLEKELVIDRPVHAPVKAGQGVGWMLAKVDGKVVSRVELVALNDVLENTWLNRVKLWFDGFFS